MIIGTAGHIDHGKTTLIQALTGVNTDRLPEEKQRGITIELGFAYLPTPDGRILGFVDVPGHEKFVHTMTAGASGIEHALLVIAADDGIMPQTREHLSILQFMQVTQFTVALTKIDRVMPELVTQRQHEITNWLAEQGLVATIFPVAAVQQQGILALREHLFALPEQYTAKAQQGLRYAIDRCFILQGHGVTVSGLIHTGTVQVGDTLTLSPTDLPARIRSIHAQNQAVMQAHAGERCGLVLVGVEREQVQRGDWLVSSHLHAPTERFDAWLQVAKDAATPLCDGLEVMLHHGAERVTARLVLLNASHLHAGNTGLVQCCLSKPLAVFWQDRLVLRALSGQSTLAGGLVLDTQPPLRGRKKPERIPALQALRNSHPAPALAQLAQVSPQPLRLQTWAQTMNQNLSELIVATQALLPSSLVLEPNKQAWLLTANHQSTLQAQLTERLTAFHTQQADEPGLSSERLRRMAFPQLDTELFSALLECWQAQGVLKQTGSFWHAPEHVLMLNPQEHIVWETLLPLLQQGQFEPPWVRDLAAQSHLPEAMVRQVLSKQARRGELFQIVQDLFYTPEALQQLAAIAQEQAQPILNVIEFRDALGIGRKRAIQILEFFDRVGFTRRIVGIGGQGKKRDERLLRNAQLFLEQ